MRVWRDSFHGRRLTIQRTSSVNRVLLIGAGTWSQKISSAIRDSDRNWEAEIVSARDFISIAEDLKDFYELCNKFELIWITTTPQNQIIVLKQLEQFKKKIILEKPIVTKESEIVVLRKIICDSQAKIYLSQPWTFSTLWSEAKKILLTMEGGLAIQAERGGTLLRSGFPPEIDWGPHDLYLLYDYAHDLGAKGSDISLASKRLKENKIHLGYALGTVTTLEIEIGYINPRKAMWKVYSEEKEVLNLDFQNSELVDYRHGLEVRSKFSGDNPIITMLDYCAENNSDIDWDIVFELYRDLVQR